MEELLNFDYTTAQWTMIICLSVLLLCQILYYILIYGKVLRTDKKRKRKNHTDNSADNASKGVSIVITTNNNGEDLREKLIFLLEQEYDPFEVVVVNENSTDDTEFILYVLKENYPNLSVINLGENANGFDRNKFSVSIGIRSAKYDYVLLTGVNCAPQSYDWLSEMMAYINANNGLKILSAPALREKTKNVFADMLEKYDETISYMNLIGCTLVGNAYTACGYNMIYDKNYLINSQGFISQYANDCKQEDYFVHRHSDRRNTDVVYDKNSFVYLPAYTSYRSFRRIKFADCLSKKNLHSKDKFLLAVMPVCAFLSYVGAALLLFCGFQWQYILSAFVIKWLLQIIYCKKSMALFGTKVYWIYAPLLEIYFFFFNFFIRLRVLFYKKKQKKIRWEK